MILDDCANRIMALYNEPDHILVTLFFCLIIQTLYYRVIVISFQILLKSVFF